jgi:glycosyltransferase involved in cell wall biosynthesis
MGEGPLVSVVTPVYNGAAYLAECIESVLAQTYEHWEYVICENCSTDGSGEVADRYAAIDPRIRVVRSAEHLPQMANWNRAMRLISPDSVYTKVVHADDRLEPSCLERMVAAGEAHPTARYIGAMRRVGEVVDLDGIPPTASVVPGRWLGRAQILGAEYTFGTPSSTMVRSELVRARPRFYDERYVHADVAVCYEVLHDCDFAYVAEPLTTTRLHDGSVTTWASRVGTWTPEHLRMYLEYGWLYASERDLEVPLAWLERRYILMLCKWTVSTKLFRKAEARRYHRRALGEIRRLSHLRGRRLHPVLRAFALLLWAGAGESPATSSPGARPSLEST